MLKVGAAIREISNYCASHDGRCTGCVFDSKFGCALWWAVPSSWKVGDDGKIYVEDWGNIR